VVPLGVDVGEVAEVKVGVGGGGEVDDLLPERLGGLVGRGACGVAVAEDLGAAGLDAALEALDLSPGEAQGASDLVGGEPSFEEGLSGLVALDLAQGKCHLRIGHGGPPCGQEALRYVAGVTLSLWR
jgi:hypothetical protein